MNSSDANNTLIDEMMQLLIAEKEKAFPTILAKLYNQAMIVERETHLEAGSYERSEGRDGYANGFKPRNYQTFHGNLELQASQLCLVSAICMEINDEWEAGMIYLNVKEL